MNKTLPLVVILGATGTGKTKLSIELAKKFGGEIISADSMQLYKGLDIITAKATNEEQKLIPHHMIDIMEPCDVSTVTHYRNKALKIIDNLLNQRKLPIVVGGTNYYIESLLWKILIDCPEITSNIDLTENEKFNIPNEELYERLKLLDPDMAKRLHPNNKRKIIRALEVFLSKGKKMSEILYEQQFSEGGSKTGGGLRYENVVIFKIECEKDTHIERLNKRIETMIKQGLIDELTNFHKLYNEQRINTLKNLDYTKGIFQSIGFKEFHEYLLLNNDERNSEKGQLIFNKCLEELKLATKRFARKQNKWINNRFLSRSDRIVPPMYSLDSTKIEQWENNVNLPATKIIEYYINDDVENCKYERMPVLSKYSVSNSEDKTFFCDICNRIFIGNYQWNIHKVSNKHKKQYESYQKKVKNQK